MSNESTPIGNVIHMGLTDGTKSDPISEVAEYFLQEREDDLFKIEKKIKKESQNFSKYIRFHQRPPKFH